MYERHPQMYERQGISPDILKTHVWKTISPDVWNQDVWMTRWKTRNMKYERQDVWNISKCMKEISPDVWKAISPDEKQEMMNETYKEYHQMYERQWNIQMYERQWNDEWNIQMYERQYIQMCERNIPRCMKDKKYLQMYERQEISPDVWKIRNISGDMYERNISRCMIDKDDLLLRFCNAIKKQTQ